MKKMFAVFIAMSFLIFLTGCHDHHHGHGHGHGHGHVDGHVGLDIHS